MEPNKTADKFSISLHPQIESEYILTENATGGILKTGNRDEIIAFCKDNLAASVNIPELEEMLDTAEVYTNNGTSCPIVEENRDTYSITRSYDGVSIEVRLTAAELEEAYRIQELNYLREDVVNFLESEDCGFTVSDFGKDGIREIALLFRDKYNDCTIPFWTGIRHAVETFAEENDIQPHFDDEESSEPSNEP